MDERLHDSPSTKPGEQQVRSLEREEGMQQQGGEERGVVRPAPFRDLLNSLQHSQKGARDIAKSIFKLANQGFDIFDDPIEVVADLFEEYPGWDGVYSDDLVEEVLMKERARRKQHRTWKMHTAATRLQAASLGWGVRHHVNTVCGSREREAALAVQAHLRRREVICRDTFVPPEHNTD